MSKLQRALIYLQKMIHLLEEKSLYENIMAVLGKYNALPIGLLSVLPGNQICYFNKVIFET